MKTFFLLPGIAAALLGSAAHDPGEGQEKVPPLKVYRLSELNQYFSAAAWNRAVHADSGVPRMGLASAITADQSNLGPMNIWPDVDLIIVGGTSAEQEATKKVVEALRRQPPRVGQPTTSHPPQDVSQAIERIKHELTSLQHALQEHK